MDTRALLLQDNSRIFSGRQPPDTATHVGMTFAPFRACIPDFCRDMSSEPLHGLGSSAREALGKLKQNHKVNLLECRRRKK